MRTAIIITLCTASALGGFFWFSSHISPPDIPMDHISQLTDKEYKNGTLREKDAIARRSPRLSEMLSTKNLSMGNPVFIRIFKESRELEIWMQDTNSGKFQHVRTWDIAAMSGKLGPKLAEGDRQAPEGFYYVNRSRMKPDSTFHLSLIHI